VPSTLPNPTVYAIAGPNGAGKKTFAQQFLPRNATWEAFVNADLIAAGLSPFKPESQAVAAGKLMLARMDDLTVGRQTFAFETTLAGRGHAKRLQSMKAVGYRIVMFFIWLPAAEMGPSGFIVDLLEFSAKENHRARQRTLPTDSRALVALDGR
jgi:predicted ABC-type ATPase